jgi:hypothetical protein
MPAAPYLPAPSAGHARPADQAGGAMGGYPQQVRYPPLPGTSRSSMKIVWWVLVLLAIGAGAGTAAALLLGSK